MPDEQPLADLQSVLLFKVNLCILIITMRAILQHRDNEQKKIFLRQMTRKIKTSANSLTTFCGATNRDAINMIIKGIFPEMFLAAWRDM